MIFHQIFVFFISSSLPFRYSLFFSVFGPLNLSFCRSFSQTLFPFYLSCKLAFLFSISLFLHPPFSQFLLRSVFILLPHFVLYFHFSFLHSFFFLLSSFYLSYHQSQSTVSCTFPLYCSSLWLSLVICFIMKTIQLMHMYVHILYIL